VALYDYQAAEDNEISFAVGETITGIEQIDENWWQGSNAAGQSGLFPAAYVQLSAATDAAPAPVAAEEAAAPAAAGGSGVTAVALYDYDAGTQHGAAQNAPSQGASRSRRCDPWAVAAAACHAAEDNEISFKVGETIREIEQIDENWWRGWNAADQNGLFPAAYVQLQ